MWTWYLLHIADLQHHFGIFGPSMRACVLGRAAHTAGFGPVGAFSRLALLPPAARAKSLCPTRGRGVSRCSPAGVIQSPSLFILEVRFLRYVRIFLYRSPQAGQPVAIDRYCKFAADECFSHGGSQGVPFIVRQRESHRWYRSGLHRLDCPVAMLFTASPLSFHFTKASHEGAVQGWKRSRQEQRRKVARRKVRERKLRSKSCVRIEMR